MVELNRRNLLVGMGGLAIGGGALLGSGAVVTSEAERDVTVNVLADEDIPTGAVDIAVNTSAYPVAVLDGDDNPVDASDEFPGSDDYDSVSSGDVTGDIEEFVSLFAPDGITDWTIAFGYGDQNRLQPNADVSFADAFLVVNDEGEDAIDFEVTLSLEADDDDPENDLSLEDDGLEDELITAGDYEALDVSVDTGDADSSDEYTLDIEITEVEPQD